MNRLRPCIFAIGLALSCAALAGEDEPRAGDDAGEVLSALDVFQLRLEDGGLVLRTTMPPTGEEEVRAFELAGPRGSAQLVNSGANGGGGGAGQAGAGEAGRAIVPDYFKLEISDDERPGRRIGIRVTWHDGALDIQQNVHYTGANRYTRLTRVLASRNPEFGTGPSVQLMVNEHGNIGREAVEVNLRARDFVTLRGRDEPATDTYLRPLLRELGQEHVLAPDPQVARQVFPERWQPDEMITRAVQRLLPGLDAPDGDAREVATGELAKLGEDAVLALLRLDRGALSAEQNSRIDAVIAAHASLTRTEAARRRRQVRFLLDCLNSDDPAIRAAGLEHLREVLTEPVEFDLSLPVPARSAAVASLREKLEESP